MNILITGICGFVGSTLAKALKQNSNQNHTVFGIDNFCRPGSETNRRLLKVAGIEVIHGDARCPSDFECLPSTDWVIDASALPSVLAGVNGESSSRQLVEHNFSSTLNILEFCKTRGAGFTLLSTSRVYSIEPLCDLPLATHSTRFSLEKTNTITNPSLSRSGISENFATTAPVSIYGATKLASEAIALEYSAAFDIPVWINRCGVLAGAGQFGKADQGIFSFWINSWLKKNALRYIGFDGSGRQVRDCLHPKDLVPLIEKQIIEPLNTNRPKIVNCSGGIDNSMSLLELSNWCGERFSRREISSKPNERKYDLPWVVLDSALARKTWDWSATTKLEDILEEIALHAESNPDWLSISS